MNFDWDCSYIEHVSEESLDLDELKDLRTNLSMLSHDNSLNNQSNNLNNYNLNNNPM
eukprot:CAMPEP_0116947328 /NCGR_PEP_ID=MMETSP0467-20121206/37597_1 /TAXON_ID=283647 /ORGANISM="Mesodinium pulex, Strain SPMC105" /LENGTH=56 /DNA_ID=CAMNT_0004631439 /DNA_START=9 /DNA_END=179 /DNA_ORIENTATION=+